MKKSWIVCSLFPLTAFCQNVEEPLFDFGQTEEASLFHILYEDEGQEAMEVINTEEFDREDLGIFEKQEEEKKSSSPWAADERIVEEFIPFLERDEEIGEEFDDAFAYEIPSQEGKGQYRPTFEKVPQEKRHLLFGRPRVVQVKPKEEQSAKQVVEKTPTKVSKKEERRRNEPQAVAKKDPAGKRVARRTSSKVYSSN